MSDQINARDQDKEVVKSTDEARQGVTGHHVRAVLFWGLGGVVAVFAIAGIVFFNG